MAPPDNAWKLQLIILIDIRFLAPPACSIRLRARVHFQLGNKKTKSLFSHETCSGGGKDPETHALHSAHLCVTAQRSGASFIEHDET
mmetsp:Transcript_21188/g.29687  ORF Transcript_21188/g.29687 Transcript_21188/m.29687 type:complete len:87 (-) Transcript_21188:2-262(-)